MYCANGHACPALLVASIVLFVCPLVAAQDNNGCRQLDPATQEFDFTRTLARWGAQDTQLVAPRTVGSITVNALPIFNTNNPAEDRWLYRLANELHLPTREQVIVDQLLFVPDQPVTEQMLEESERILRTRPYVGDARIRVLRDCQGAVDLEVVTHEVWTLTPELRFNHSGGHSTSGFGIRDTNIFGSGQMLGLQYKRSQERDEVALLYENPNIAASRQRLALQLGDNSDGYRYAIDFGKPWYALQDRTAWDSHVESVEEVLNQYRYGERVSDLHHQGKRASLAYRYAPDVEGDFINRVSAGLQYEQHELQATTLLPPPADYRPELQLFYPFVQYELLEDAFVQGYNISQIQRTEDLHLGRHLTSSLGYAGGDDRQWIVNGEYSDTLLYKPETLLQLYADWQGRWQRLQSEWEDVALHVGLDYHRGQSDQRILYLGLEAAKVVNLHNGTQLELGGRNGLRGYDTHYLQGSSSLRFTAEERWFTDYHFLQLFRVGMAAFYDVGRVYGNTVLAGDEVFQGVGLGLRLAPSRSQSGQIIHIDLAYPLNSATPASKHQLQFIAEVKKSF